LGHVDDKGDASLLGGLRKLRGRLSDPWTDRIAEVGAIYSRQCRSYGVEIQKIAIDDLGAAPLQFS